ncbi:MAG: PAS domain S-box protein [Hyphomonadaceae bacterium]|nr:PAS domain S-box protein [Hyphomonadaceae bacterium]
MHSGQDDMTGTRPTSSDPMQSLEALQLHLESVLESVPDAMIIIGEDSRILQFSRAARDLFGYKTEDIIGQPVSILMTGHDARHHHQYMQHYHDTGEARIIGVGRVVTARRADGTEFPIDLKIGEAKIGGRSIYTGFLRDLSEKQQSELRMREMQAELVHFSRLSAVGTMASALAHELNQPLTAIANYLEAGRDLLDTPDAHTLPMVSEALDEAAKQSVRAGQIVRKLRDFVSRGEIAKRAVALAPLLEDAVSLARIGTNSENVKVRFVFDESVNRVSADPIQVQQVVINLLRNAFEALSGKEGAMAEVRALPGPEPHLVAVEVCDNGPGIEPEIAAQLFKPFTSTKTTGMGLGLSICQTIIEAHGGTIYAKATEAGGTCFCFTLPRAEQESEDD